MNMFKRKKSLATGPFYTGTCLRVNGQFYYIKAGKKYTIAPRVLKSWNFTRIVDATEESIKGYRTAGKLGFRDGTVVRRFSDSKLYLIHSGLKHPIANPDVLINLGVCYEHDIIDASDVEVDVHKDGEPVV